MDYIKLTDKYDLTIQELVNVYNLPEGITLREELKDGQVITGIFLRKYTDDMFEYTVNNVILYLDRMSYRLKVKEVEQSRDNLKSLKVLEKEDYFGRSKVEEDYYNRIKNK